jgi:hypothetical protein
VSGGWIAVLIAAIALIRSREANLAEPLDMPATAADLHPPAPGATSGQTQLDSHCWTRAAL